MNLERKFVYMKNGKSLIFLALFVFLLMLPSCSTVPLTGRRQLNLVSDSEINQTSAAQYRQFVRSATQSGNSRYVDQVTRVGKRIAAATDIYLRQNGMADLASAMQWEFNTIESEQVNAFCMPGGKIVVYTGLLQLVGSDDELAAVVGHEVSHAVAKHSNERISQEMLRQLGGQIIGVAASKQSQLLQAVVGQAYGLGSQLLVALPYSRKQEYEADKMGQVFMTISGYDPQAAISFWRKMARSGQGGQNWEILSTHPSDVNRIKALEEFLPQARQYAPSAKKGGDKSMKKGHNKIGGKRRPARTSQKWRF
ncbi:Zn-dependent protease with chaperone function PA4632 [Porphyromonas crevioricanis JCM 15906]|uniref:Zn-dependent protease with chaperone function PA4632 n=2 Tax=Porphyromonas crevioricanis TaxID=393921 RepID=T1CNG0_9PORP|nr:Zn-dependent protease with chaperone function PA4632 [Porphyromonas crevioricanis JCM 15906]SJZ67779.1 Peptidase family M48 [Porphyromonas crevioricanis]